MPIASSAWRHVDFVLSGYRYPFLRVGGASAAAALATVMAHHAARCFEDHVGVVQELLPLALDDHRMCHPPVILCKPYTEADMEACADPGSSGAIAAARLAASMMLDIERAKKRLAENSGDLDLLVQRRLLGSLLLHVSEMAAIDCCKGISRIEALGCEEIILLLPLPNSNLDPVADFEVFWSRVDGLPWTRAGYASLVASVLITVCRRFDIDLERFAHLVATSRGAGCRIAPRWNEMPAGPPDAVGDIVDLTRALSDVITGRIADSAHGRSEMLARVARALCPASPDQFARRFRAMAPCWNADLPETIAPHEMVLVLGDAPAVVL